ncbi:hypothetical protein Tco_0692352 [Tanacetum coccineum]
MDIDRRIAAIACMRMHSPESIENGVKSSFQRNAITTTTIWLRGKCVSAPNVWSSFSTICLDTHICIRIREIQGGCDEVFLTDSLDSKSTEDDSSNHDDGADNVATNKNDKIYDDESDSNNLFLGGGWVAALCMGGLVCGVWLQQTKTESGEASKVGVEKEFIHLAHFPLILLPP